MSGSETGVLNSGANIGMRKSPAAPPQPVIQSMHLSFGTDGNPMYKPVTGNGNGNGSEGMNINMGMAVGEPCKKKRGRPRKYVPAGSIAVPISSVPPGAFSTPPPPQPPQPQHHPPPPHQSPPTQHQTQPLQQQSPQQLQQQSPQQLQQHQTQPAQSPPPPPQQAAAAVTTAGSPTSMKKARGRPPGSRRKSQLEAVGSLGIGFTPHVITVNSGEDVASRIMSFSQTGPRAVCILSAIGALSNVTLRQAATSGGSVTYEGHFEILSLSGSFMLSDDGGPRSRTGGLSVSLAGPDGRVLGGGVAGLLIAASPVQVVVGSFISDNRREPKTGNLTEPLYASAKSYPATGQTGPNSPPSRGTLSESSGVLNQSTGAVNSTPISMSSLPWK